MKRFSKKARAGGDYQSLKKSLDRVFSRYIRLRDSNELGLCRCVTCGAFFHWKELHCGHFVTRNHLATRWDERNCNAQCVKCNSFNSGEQFKHGQAIDKKFGKGTAEFLQNLGGAKAKVNTLWLKMEIEKVKKKIKDLEKK